MFTGILNLPWWGDILVLLVLVQITIAAVTLYLHRAQAHRALEMHPAINHFFRLWLWLTTGMVTKEWTAIHRKHHAKCETVDDPHSPQVHGIKKILFGGVVLYVRESRNAETIEKYGHNTPDDWLERNLYTPCQKWGIVIMAAIDIALFGVVPGALMFGIQMAWIPFWAAGVINGIGHFWGYRNFQTEDASTNITPWGAWIGGEELHNNHHAYPTSAKFSIRAYEFDLGWMYIRILSALGLAEARRTAGNVKLDPSKLEIDAQTLQAVIQHRYEVLAKYAKSLRATTQAEVAKIQFSDTAMARKVRSWMHTDTEKLGAEQRAAVDRAIESSPVLAKTHKMRKELSALWQRSTLSTEQLVKQLDDWCRRAEASDIEPLMQFSRRLRSYAA
jgi:stearoyl-CoA desaturase (Delta-9 desaturase)